MTPFPTRRVVTGHDAAGRDVILADGAPRVAFEAPGGPAVAEHLWLASRPATAAVPEDRSDGGFPLEPPPGGASVRVIRLPPAGDAGWVRVPGDDPARPGFHTTDTLDVEVVIDGEMILGLDDAEHRLGPGDIVVQRGTDHRWRVPGPGPCTYAALMLRTDSAAQPVEMATRPPERDGISVRRLVTGVDAGGGSRAITDGPPPSALSAADGFLLADVWQTGGPLATAGQGGDSPGGFELEPLGGGVACRIVRLPAGHDPGEAGWHTTRTIDVNVILSGAVQLELPGAPPLVLSPGEVVVQGGTSHRWKPVGDSAAQWFAVMVSVATAFS